MNTQFVLSVYRANNTSTINTVQHYNYTDMLEACRKASALKAERWVRKVELSVIIHTWQERAMITMTLLQFQDLQTQIKALVEAAQPLGREHLVYQLAFALSHTLSDIVEGHAGRATGKVE